MATKREVREAAAVLRRLLDAVDRGDVTAEGPVGAGVVRQLRGAIVALDTAAATDQPEDRDPSRGVRRTARGL